MNCESVKNAIPLYFYGELPPEEEERVEDHLDGCAACREELERQRTLAAALDRRRVEPSDDLLAECRGTLMRAVVAGQAPARPLPRADAWTSLRDGFSSLLAPLWTLRWPAGAVALVALGWFSARLTSPAARRLGTDLAAEPVISRVSSVRPDPSGRVEISLDEIRKRVVTGRLDDGNIRRLLLAASRDEANPGVRVESVGILKDHAASAEVRAALLNVVVQDPNPGVRLKALEGLKSFAGDGEVRKTLAQVLLKDDNPGVRIQAIDMLTMHCDDSVVGVLQNLVERDNNSYIRFRCERALRDLNASIGTF